MEGAEDEENANNLKFGADFENVSCLSNAEVSVVLDRQRANYQEKDINVTPAFAKTLAYVKRFGGLGSNAQATSVQELRECSLEEALYQVNLWLNSRGLGRSGRPIHVSLFCDPQVVRTGPLYTHASGRRALQQFEAFHDGEVIKLHQFEVMQVANLMQTDSEVDEVLALIPSLGARLTEEDLENVLAIVRKHQHARLYS